MALHSFFKPDLLMDLGMLLVTQLAFGAFRLLRLLAAALLLAVCTKLAMLLDLSPVIVLFIHPVIFILGAAVATDARRPGRILEAAICMFCTSAASAGFMMLGGQMILPAMLSGCAFLLFLLRRRRHENYHWNIEIYVEKDGLGASLPALIDTGNRLTEHRDRQPVLIAESKALGKISSHIASLPRDQLQFLPFGVLGSSGEICSFHPDKVEIILPGRKRRPAPPCWVAVYPGRIPGNVRALAPPAFVLTLKPLPKIK